MLWAISVVLLGQTVILAQGAGSTAPEMSGGMWIVQLISSGASTVATIFAYLTARDAKMYDADKKIQAADLARALDENRECKEDRVKLHAEQARQNRKIDRLMRRTGVAESEDDDAHEDDCAQERRTNCDKNYRGPRRRKTDSRSHKPIAPAPDTPESDK